MNKDRNSASDVRFDDYKIIFNPENKSYELHVGEKYSDFATPPPQYLSANDCPAFISFDNAICSLRLLKRLKKSTKVDTSLKIDMEKLEIQINYHDSLIDSSLNGIISKYNQLNDKKMKIDRMFLYGARTDSGILREASNSYEDVLQKIELMVLDRDITILPPKQEPAMDKIINNTTTEIIESYSEKINKGGRPTDPKIAETKKQLSKDYYYLRDVTGLTKPKAIELLSKKYPQWKKSTIEKYIK
ncbi:MAG: hypothetical protein HN600_01885 [Bacteroidetes bacterium]|jgi:hypothetical protein|nr:hypothetical protein [Bacteroidota bacterium]